MKIADIDLGERPVMLAPMEDVTDQSFRLICKELGADMTYSEFVSADALIRNIAATTRKLHIEPAERPTAIQIYGREVGPMVEAARTLRAGRLSHFPSFVWQESDALPGAFELPFPIPHGRIRRAVSRHVRWDSNS